MKSFGILFIAMFFASTSLFATSNESFKEVEAVETMSISGMVIDHITGEGLAGVKINIGGSEVYSDFEGNFSLTNIVPGQYNVTTQYISYEDLELNLNLNSSISEPLVLKPVQVSSK